MDDFLPDRVAVVSGAAGGIGAAITEALAQADITVAALDCAGDRLQTVAEKLAAEDLPVQPFVADIADPVAVEATVADIESQLGPIGYLVNAAGVLRLSRAVDLTDADWSTTFAVNATGTFNLCRSVVRRMVSRASGAVVTVASNAADVARVDMAAYAASKAAVAAFTKCLALEVARYGIRCNVVAPGSTDTPMLSGMWHDESGPAATLNGQLDSFRVGIPLGKIARPADVADAVRFLLSNRASHITMHTLTVDGGASLGA
jgi:2,3-dihydro-2,3-dihydroxybenzoate dehydrogenase